MIKGIIAIVVPLLFFQNCAPSRYVKPLEKKSHAVSVSFGGPVIAFAGAYVPIPFTTAGYAHGISSRVTGYAHLHTTSLLFGNFQSDVGATIGLLPAEKKIGVSVSPALQQAFSLRHKTGFRIWPSADLNLYYTTKGASFFYTGVNTWLELQTKRAHDEKRPRSMVPNIHTGYTFAGTKWQHQVEVKYLGAGIPVYPGIVDYKGIGGKGSFGLYYSVIKKI
jgi:hypothetical protein